MALGIGYGLPLAATKSSGGQYKSLWNTARTGAKASGATVEDESADSSSCLVTRGADIYNDVLPTTPSLLIVPQFYKSANLYQDIPAYSADDSTMKFAVTRATTATRVNSSGLIETVASGVPRVDWLGQSCPALLVEPSATNFARFVQQMTAQDTPTASGGMTITTGSTDFLAPDGTSGSINKYVGGAASGVSQYAYYTGGGIIVTAAGQHTFSLFVKAGATNPLNFCALEFTAYSGGSGTAISYFSLANGTALTAGASIQDYGNGWYRLISAPYTIASGDLNGQLLIMAEANNDISFPASGALNLTAYTWGAQLEASSVATTYIPTTTASVTRNADVITASGALVSGLIGQTEGTMYCEFEATNNSSTRRIFTISDNSTSNRIMLIYNAGEYRAQINATSVALGNFTSGFHKIAFAYEQSGVSGNLYASIDGGAVVSGTSANFPTSLTFMTLGKHESSSNTESFNSRIRAAALYTTRLTNAQLAALTA